MIDARTFTAIDLAGRHCRNNLHTLCGGVQLVLVGDFFQLPPVCNRRSSAPRHEGEGRFCFESKSWGLLDETIELTTAFRQPDPRFAHMLNCLRKGTISDGDLQELAGTQVTTVCSLALTYMHCHCAL